MALIPLAPNLVVGGVTFTDLKNLIQLYAAASNATYTTFRKSGSSSGYTPSGSTVFHISAVQFATNSNTLSILDIFYGSTDVGLSNASPPSGVVNIANDNVNNGFLIPVLENVGQSPLDFIIPNGKFPCFFYPSGGVGSVILFGYEQ